MGSIRTSTARAIAFLVSGLAAGGGLRSTAHARAAGTVAITVDATAAGPPLEPVWSYFGYDEVNYTNTPDGEALLRTLAAASAVPVKTRTHFLFNTGDGTPALKWGSTNLYTEDASGNPVYDYTRIDAIMDATLGAGAVPLVEIGFMPQALSTRPEPYENSNTYLLDGGSFYPPRDYDRWASLVTAWAAHVKERYPGAEASWQWELWNEPDIGYWHGTFEDYARLYDHTEAALHEVFPGAPLGGPAVARADGSFLPAFLAHCATGANAVTGATGTRLDRVSFHAKGGVSIQGGHVQMNLGEQLRLHQAGFDAVAASPFARTPIVISEADPDGCAACPVSTAPHHAYRNSPAYGAYEVAMMKHTLDLASERGVDLRGVLTWAFTFPGSPYFAGYRALTTNGIHLPVLNAFVLLGSLRGARLPASSSGARPLSELIERGVRQQPDVDALAAIEGDRVRVLVWNYHDDLVDVPAQPVALRVAVPPAFGANLEVTHTRVDHAHGDAYTLWTAQGSPVSPSDEQLAELRAGMEPQVLSREAVTRAADGNVSVAFELPRFGLSLFTIAPLTPDAPDADADSPAPSGVQQASDTSPPSRSGCSLVGVAASSSRAAAWVVSLALPLAFARARRRSSTALGQDSNGAASARSAPPRSPARAQRP